MRIAFAFAAVLVALPAAAQQPGVAVPGAQSAGPADIRVNQLIIYGDDPCPQSIDPNEVTVCARLPDDDRFRVPPNLRNNPNDPASQSWANRALELQYVGLSGTGSCSPTGAGGFTGCFVQLANQGRAERRNNDQVNWARMIEEARQRRLSQIDAAAAQEEEEALRREREAANRPN